MLGPFLVGIEANSKEDWSVLVICTTQTTVSAGKVNRMVAVEAVEAVMVPGMGAEATSS